MALVLDLGEVRGVGPGGDRHQDVGQGAEPVGDPHRLGQVTRGSRIRSDGQAVEPEEGDDQPVGEPPGPGRQARPGEAPSETISM